MSLESTNAVADQQTQNLLAFSGLVMQSRVSFFEAAVNQQITDIIENPSDPMEVLGNISTSAAALRGSQPPIQTP